MRLLHLAAGAAAAAVLLCGLPVASAAAGQTLGVPVGQGDLSGVTCPAANDCWAVGDGGSPQTEPPGLEAAELWHGNGKHWASVQVPLPRAIWGPDSAARANGVDGLSRVTCVTRKDCWAVGWYDGGTLPGPVGFRNFILHYDGQTWTETAAPTPANTEQLGLRGVACAAANDCWAVGGGGGLTVGWLPQALHWNGHVWALAKLPVTYGRLAAVTCSGGTCWAVGSLGKKDPGSAPAQGSSPCGCSTAR